MKSSKFWIAVIAASVAVNILDFVVQGMWLAGAVYSKMPETFTMDTNPVWFVVGDIVAIFVLAWVYDRVYGSFGGAMKGGAVYGLYAGILVNFPMFIFVHLMIRGFSYHLAWIMTVYGVIWTVIAGAIIGPIYKKGAVPVA